MLPKNCRHWSEENGEHDHANAQPHDHIIEGLFVESGIHFLEHHERIIDVTNSVAATILNESHFLRTVDALKKHGSNFQKVARLAVFLLKETVEVNGVVLGIGHNLCLVQHGGHGQDIRFKAP